MNHTTTLAPQNVVAVWERVLIPAKENLSPEQARYFLGLRFPPRDVRRMNMLSKKAGGGTLTPREDEELENYIQVGHLLGILRSRARQVLNKPDRRS